LIDTFLEVGWQKFAWDKDTALWARVALAAATEVLSDPQHVHWYQCENTWFVGVDTLPNELDGSIKDTPLIGPAMTALQSDMGFSSELHRAQISAIFPGYPRPRANETATAFRYRLQKCGAHIDGLLREGETRRRYLREPHAWILGLPLTDCTKETSPLVVWEGSHHIMTRFFSKTLAEYPVEQIYDFDLTDVYLDARREIFETCTMVPVCARPGEGYLVHRLTLHGIAPWRSADHAQRIIVYFRPKLAQITDWPRLGSCAV